MAQSRIRRIRPVIKHTSLTAAEKAQMQVSLKLISDSQIEMARLQKLVASHESTLLHSMQKHKLGNFQYRGIHADIVQSPGKAQNIVDPKALRRTLKKDTEYYDCVSVSITKAKKYLSEKELGSITTNIPGTPGEKKLKITIVEVSEE